MSIDQQTPASGDRFEGLSTGDVLADVRAIGIHRRDLEVDEFRAILAWADRNTVVPSLNWLHHYNEAARLAFADRALYVADPDFTKAPGGDWNKMLAPAYLQQRASLVQNQRMGNASAGQPGGAPMALAPMADQTEYGTSHISIIDRHGNALAMTTTIEAVFGARRMVSAWPAALVSWARWRAPASMPSCAKTLTITPKPACCRCGSGCRTCAMR